MLTILGESFPNRVVSSLYGSFESADADEDGNIYARRDRLPMESSLEDMLVGYSQKEFEDMAVRLVSDREAIRRLKNELAIKVERRDGIFDSKLHTMNFLHGMEAIAEVKVIHSNSKARNELPHVSYTGH